MMKRKAGDQVANSSVSAITPLFQQQLENRNSSAPSSQNSIDSNSEQQRRQRDYEAKVRKSLDLTHFVNYLRELCSQNESESDSESSDNGTSPYLPPSPLQGLMGGIVGVHNNSSILGILPSEEYHHSQSHDFGPIDMLNENSSSTISDDHLRYNSNQSRAASKMGKTMFNSAPVSLMSSARSSINGSVTKSSYSSSNSTLSDEDSSQQRLGNGSDSSDDEHCGNDSDSDVDLALPMSDNELAQLVEASKAFSTVRFANDEKTSINFVEALHAASKSSRSKPGTSKDQLKKLFGVNRSAAAGGKLSRAAKNHSAKKPLTSTSRTDHTIAGAMSTFKTPKNFSSGKVAPIIKLERLEPETKSSKIKSEQTDTPSPAKRRRKKHPTSDTSSLNEQVMDMNTSQSTLSLDSYFKTETNASVSTKARSTSSTSSLDKFSHNFQGLKSKKLSPERKLELLNLKRKRVYILICKRDIPKAYKNRQSVLIEKIAASKRLGFTATQSTKDKTVQSSSGQLGAGARSSSEICNSNSKQTLTFHSAQDGAEVAEAPSNINEILKVCPMGSKQKLLYESLHDQIKSCISQYTEARPENKSFAVKQLLTYLVGLRVVCNHANLWSKSETRSPLRHQLNVYYPKLLFCDKINNLEQADNKLCIYHPHNVYSSLFPKVQMEDLNVSSTTGINSEWSFLRFIGTNLEQVYSILDGQFGSSLQQIARAERSQEIAYHQRLWMLESGYNSKSTSTLFLTDYERPISSSKIGLSSLSSNLIIKAEAPTNELKGRHVFDVRGNRRLTPCLDIPPLLYCFSPKVTTQRVKVYFRGFRKPVLPSVANHWEKPLWLDDSSKEMANTPASCFNVESWFNAHHIWNGFPAHGFSDITVQEKCNHAADSGKLLVLEELLRSLITRENRAALVSQLPEMIELLEGYLKPRKWVKLGDYVRLSLTSQVHKLLEVSQGCGSMIDTIIFYDSSTERHLEQEVIESVQMQSKSDQVFVYRLVCKDTLEEDMLFRAKEVGDKYEKQPMVTPLFLENSLLPKELKADLITQMENIFRKNSVDPPADASKEKLMTGPIEESQIDMPPFTGGQSTIPEVSENKIDTNGDEADSNEMEEGCEAEEQDCPSIPALDRPSSSRSLPSHSLDFESSEDEELASLPKPRKISRGMGRRGRPPTRIRFGHRDYDGRRPGRPRLKPFGPQNQATRGRGPGRPPLTRKIEPLLPQRPTLPGDQSVFDYNSSPEPDLNYL